MRRARKPALKLYTLPGGAVETGETLVEAVMREVREETALDDRAGRARRPSRGDRARRARPASNAISSSCALPRAGVAGEPVLNEELDDARWLDPAELAGLRTTEGLAEIVAAAFARLAATA